VRLVLGVVFLGVLGVCFFYVVVWVDKTAETNNSVGSSSPIRGSVKILFTTCQIISTLSWTVEIKLPGLLHSISYGLESLLVEVPWKCLVRHSAYPLTVYLDSLLPLGCLVLIWITYAVRRARPRRKRVDARLLQRADSDASSDAYPHEHSEDVSQHQQLLRQHSAASLLLL
jgi:hypothetical protein